MRVGTLPPWGSRSLAVSRVAAGHLTPYQLRSTCVAIHRDVYIPRGSELTAVTRARAAWLWSGRAGIVAGQSAAALHGAKWVDDRASAQLLYPQSAASRRNHHLVGSIRRRRDVARSDGSSRDDPRATALDIACRYPRGRAVAAIDSLARATKLEGGRRRVARRASSRTAGHSCRGRRTRPRGRGRRVTAGDQSAPGPHRAGLPASGDPDSRLRRVGALVGGPRHGLAGSSGGRRLRGRAPPDDTRRDFSRGIRRHDDRHQPRVDRRPGYRRGHRRQHRRSGCGRRRLRRT